MNFLINLMALIAVMPFIALEAVIKLIGIVLSIIFAVIVAVFYPLIKKKPSIIIFLNRIFKYSTTLKHGFKSIKIYYLWMD